MAYDVLVVGSGPAGLSAALQVRARGRSVLVVGDERDSGLYKAPRIDNYLGLPALSGAELLARFSKHVLDAGGELRKGKVLAVMPAEDRFFVSVDAAVEEAGALILALGVARGQKLPGEAEYLGRGVSYCATCDGGLYRNRRVAVVGLSAEAPEEALFLASLGCQVTFIAPRRPAQLSEDIPYVQGKQLEIKGEKTVTGLWVDGKELPCDGVFLLRPSLAPADLLPGLQMEGGYIQVDRDQRTGTAGVYAAGDCTGAPLQVSKAVGEGMIAGQRAAEYVDRRKTV